MVIFLSTSLASTKLQLFFQMTKKISIFYIKDIILTSAFAKSEKNMLFNIKNLVI